MSLGYVVIEWNQASKQPSIYAGADLCDTLDEAIEVKQWAISQTRLRGRRETYGIARVVLDEPYESWEQ